MNDQLKEKYLITLDSYTKRRKIILSDVINFLVFSMVFFSFNMVFTPGKWWSVIPIGIYALLIVATHSDKILQLREDKILLNEISRLENEEDSSVPLLSSDIKRQEINEKSELLWNDDDMV